MSRFFESGHVIDLVLGFILIEAILLATWRMPRTRMGIRDIILALLPGACLLLAVRAALTDAGWAWVAFWVTASLPAHLLDLRGRLKR